MKIQLTRAQYSALLDIYGPPEAVHYMLMTANFADNKVFIDGTEDDFEALINIICEEICSRKNASQLIRVCKKIDPSSLDWIGM